MEVLKPQHGLYDPFDQPMVLLDNVVEVFASADLDSLRLINIILLDGGHVGTTFVDINQAPLAT